MSQTALDPSPSLAEIRAAAGRPDTRSHAIDLAIKALGAGLEDPLVLKLVSEGLEQDGRLQDALGLAHRSTLLHPERVESWTEFSRLLLLLRRRDEALEATSKILELDADSFDGHTQAATVYFSLNNFEAATHHAGEAARLRPDAAEPLSTLAIIAARQRQYATARDFAERALALNPALGGAQIAVARAELGDDDLAAAIARLEHLVARPDVSPNHRAEGLNILGEARDAAGDPARAFAAFAASNAELARQGVIFPEEGPSPPDHAHMLERYFQAADKAAWRAGVGEDGVRPKGVLGHAFIVGFPRSGTTLLENALAGHPRILTLEETDALAQASSDWLVDEVGMDRLAHLNPEEADASRKIYWRRVGELLNSPLDGKVVVDKMPISTVALPVISKLFPDARILFARRDPRDVVLSCFRRLFAINSMIREFLTLEGTARYYDCVMRLAVIFEEMLPLNQQIVRHEDVIADFDGVLGEALAFLGLEWDSEVRDFSDRGLRARTPSATQLARGLDAGNAGAWRRYAHELAPILPLLDPWVTRFGYEPTDPAMMPAPPDPAFADLREAIDRALRAGDWPRVFAQVEEAFAKGCSDPLLFRLRGVRAQQEGRLAAAVADFETALADAPGEIGLLSALGLCLARLGRGADALARLNEAIALQPGFAPAHFNRGYALESLGDLAAAGAAYERAAQLDPRDARSLGALAVLASRRADWTRARVLAARGLALAPDLPSASMALAAAEAAQGEAKRAERRLSGLLQTSKTLGPHERAAAQCALGDVLDQLERPSEAFAAYEAAAAGFRGLHEPRFNASGKERSSALAGRLGALFEAADSSAWRRPSSRSPNDVDGKLVFLVGFPRSGASMLGQALACHPDVITLEEQGTLAESAHEFFRDAGGLARLARISEAEAKVHRRAYWADVRSSGAKVEGRLVVDKMPMNTLGLPLIARLFPTARVVFLRRDPRDVVLSCFRRNFVINPTTVEFLTLQGAASLYDLTMKLMETYRAKLDLDLRIQSYEALVEDFDGDMRALGAFIGLPHDERMADFAARAAMVATPSSTQIAKGLNAEGVGAWRRYREHLAPVMEVLASWVEKFGYPAD